MLVATDGAPGLIRAVEECFPSSLRQRCLAHKMRNILAKVPREHATEWRQMVRAVYDAPSLALAKTLSADLVRGAERWRGITITEFERRQLEKLQKELRTKHRAENKPVVTSAEKNPTRIYSKNRT